MGRHSARGSVWESVRDAAIVRARRRCERCGRRGRLEVHHRVPVEEAPKRRFDPTNLEVLCRDCHIGHHRKDAMTPERAEWHDFVRGEVDGA